MTMQAGMNVATILALVVMHAGCTSISVKPLDVALDVRSVCIKENPKVIVRDFIDVLCDGFDRHGIKSRLFSDNPPVGCEYIVTYNALQTWDLSPYLSEAVIRIERNGEQIARADYHLVGKGGLSLTKWQGTKTKIDPVIDELLRLYRGANFNGKVTQPAR